MIPTQLTKHKHIQIVIKIPGLFVNKIKAVTTLRNALKMTIYVINIHLSFFSSGPPVLGKS